MPGGGVGHVAIQLARAAGARVCTTVSGQRRPTSQPCGARQETAHAILPDMIKGELPEQEPSAAGTCWRHVSGAAARLLSRGLCAVQPFPGADLGDRRALRGGPDRRMPAYRRWRSSSRSARPSRSAGEAARRGRRSLMSELEKRLSEMIGRSVDCYNAKSKTAASLVERS